MSLAAGADGEFHGYLMASRIREDGDGRTLTAHGTLYKALDRMRKAGLLTDRWEDPGIAASEERPRRRLYRVTAEGAAALAEAERSIVPALTPGAQPA